MLTDDIDVDNWPIEKDSTNDNKFAIMLVILFIMEIMAFVWLRP